MDVTIPDRLWETIRESSDQLTAAERRVADVVLSDPESVAFGTVAEVAVKAGTSGPTVIRFADRLGYPGFVGLQAKVRGELSQRLRPAAERLRAKPGGQLLDRVLVAEVENVRRTLGSLDEAHFQRAVKLLSDPKRRVHVLASEQMHAVGYQLATELAILRDGVGDVLTGSPFGVVTRLAALSKGDVVVTVDLRRHERWLLEAAAFTAERGAARIAVTDSLVSPLCEGADCALTVSAAATGPFDSGVGALALFNALICGVAERRRRDVTRRIDALEAVWREADVFAQD